MRTTDRVATTRDQDGDESALLVPARMLNEYTYCARLFYLEWVQGEFVDSADTIDGRFKHQRVDQQSGRAAAPGGDRADTDDKECTAIHARSVDVSSMELGAIARIDLLEGTGQQVTPVDYKRGKVPQHLPERAWESDRVQLCIQGLILRDNGYTCSSGILYYIESRERVVIPFDEGLIERTQTLLTEAKHAAHSAIIPPPLVDSPKCPRCSLVGLCLPDEVNALAGRGSVQDDRDVALRRLMPARSDALPVYVMEQGASVGKSGEVLEVRRERAVLQEIRLIDISQLCLYGNITVSAQAIYALSSRGIPICHFSYGGWFHSITQGLPGRNVGLRQRQFALVADAAVALSLAREVVCVKIKNCRTLLRRNGSNVPETVLPELARLATTALRAPDLGSLLGIEGAAARLYFAHFPCMMKTLGDHLPFLWQGRNRRPPTDPINAMLSFVYALLAKDLTVLTAAVGFDPYLGFYHQPHFGRASLALDLAEEFRPLVADSVVLSLVNNREVTPGDFVVRAGAVALSSAARKSVLAAYERRMAATIRHPLFGYTISYRRIMEVQTRLLARFLLHEIPSYPPFRTR